MQVILVAKILIVHITGRIRNSIVPVYSASKETRTFPMDVKVRKRIFLTQSLL